MERNEFKILISLLKDLETQGDEWIDKVPHEVNASFFDNPYVNCLQKTNDLLMATVFANKPELLEEVEWFLYEWEKDKDPIYRTINTVDSTYTIDTVDNFVNYLEDQGYFK